MPLKSQAQRAWMHIHHPKMAKRWEKHTPKGKLPKHVGEALDPKSETSVAQFQNELMRWARESGIKPSEARELRDAFWSLYQVLPEIMPDTTPEEFGREYMQHWRDNGMVAGEGVEMEDEANMVQMHSIGEMFGIEKEPVVEQPVLPYATPKMNEVFVVEAPIQNRPPPGSQPLKPTEYTALGSRGQALKTGMDAMTKAGQEMTPYKTPQGEIEAFPKDAAPGRGPVKADVTKGAWTPMTGSAQGTPFSSQTPTTTMK